MIANNELQPLDDFALAKKVPAFFTVIDNLDETLHFHVQSIVISCVMRPTDTIYYPAIVSVDCVYTMLTNNFKLGNDKDRQ
jgi:hypothetical protein